MDDIVSSDAAGSLSFSCPKCSKKLRAPEKLAGQKLSCPHCQALIRVPGVVQKAIDDDEWLSLDSPKSTQDVPSPSTKSIASTKSKGASSSSRNNPGQSGSAAGRASSASVPAKSPPTNSNSPASVSPTPSGSTASKPEALNPLPSHRESRPKTSKTEAPKAEAPKAELHSKTAAIDQPRVPVVEATKRSVFDDDLPDLLPLESERPSSFEDVPIPLDEPELFEPIEVMDADEAIEEAQILDADLEEIPLAPLVLEDEPNHELASLEPLSTKTAPVTQSSDALARPSSKANGKPKTSKSVDTKSVDTSLPAFGEIDDDLMLAPLSPSDQNKSSKPLLVGDLEEIMLQSEALVTTGGEASNDEFSFRCKTCNTMLYARESQVGTRKRCPDCHCESTVPTAPPKINRKIKGPERESFDVSFAPVDAQSVREPQTNKVSAEQLLERAKEDVEREKKELDGIKGSFDGKRWIALIFWYLQDPTVIIVTISLCILSGLWMGVFAYAPTIFKLEGAAAAILQAVVFLLPLIPIGACCLLASLSVFTMVANQMKRVDDWAFSRIGDALGDLFMLLGAVAIASIPGGMIGTVLNKVFGGFLGTVSFSMISIWILFPFVFLSMANNNRVTEPYSKVVWESLRSRADSWGAMYLQTMFAFSGYFLLVALALMPGVIGEILAGLFLPWFLFFVMNQYGLLAGRLSDVTELGFEGDFSADNVE